MPRFRNLEQNFLSRRRFLKMLGAGTACATIENTAPLAPAAKIPAQSEPAPDFEEIPPSASGISWVHTAGLSSSMYLPETDGAGRSEEHTSELQSPDHLVCRLLL